MHTDIDLRFLSDWNFGHGTGNFDAKSACVMSGAVAAIRMERGADLGDATDRLECVCPIVRGLLIRRNDSTPVDDIKPWALSMIPRILGTDGGASLRKERARRVLIYVLRGPLAAFADRRELSVASNLKAVGNEASLSAIRDVARAARDSFRGIAAAADAAADAYADAAAYVAYAAAAAYVAYAAAYAESAARAAAHAARAADQDEILCKAANIGLSALRECGSPGVALLDQILSTE